DLHRRSFTAGQCAQTLLARAGVVLVCRDAEQPSFWIFVRASFARYLADWLADAAAEDGAWPADGPGRRRRAASVSEVRAVVATGQGKPVEVTTIVVPDPGPDEVAVDVRACGICPADLRYRDDGVDGEFPMLLGHEVAGTVAAVGVGVHHVEPGDLVVLDWRAVCGTCRACRRGRPQRCCDTPTADQPMTLTDGTPLSTALGIGGFAERTLVHAAQCTKAGPAWRPAVAGLLGCGVLAGFGAAVYTAPTGPGDS